MNSTFARWKTSNTAVYNLSYHIIWCTKYRRPLLQGEIAERLKVLLYEKADELCVEVSSLEVMPDHVHLFVRCMPIHQPQLLVGWLKGYTSHVLREEFRECRSRVPTLWTRSYYIDSVGKLTEKNIQIYIENQKNK